MGYFRLPRFLLAGIILLLVFLTSKSAIAGPLRERKVSKRTEYVVDEVVVKFKKRLALPEFEKFNQRLGTRLTRERRFADFVTLRAPRGINPEDYAERLRGEPQVEYAEPNYIAYALMTPNDPYFPYQWHFDNPEHGGVNAQAAWDVSSGLGVKVAIVDTGIAYENYWQNWWNRYEQAPDLAGTCFVPGFDFVNNDSHANDDEGHGTHVAGTVAQTTNNNLGMAGLAHSACLMPVKVLNSGGSGSYADIAEGIRFAADNGAGIINLSLGGSADASSLKQAVAYAYGKGVTVVAASGNDGKGSVLYPAAYDDYVIAVGATRYDKTLAYYSNYGSSLDLVAPGGDLRVDQNNDGYNDGILQQTFDGNPRNFGYWFYQGTSCASPHVAAAAALVIANGTTGPDNIRVSLEGSAQDLGSLGRDNIYGWGLIDAAVALGVISSPSPTPSPTFKPTPTPSPTPSPSPSPSPSQTPSPTPTATPIPSPLPTPKPGEFKVSISQHTATARWNRWSGGRIDFKLIFKIESGFSSTLIVKEVTDKIGNWGLYRDRTKVDVYINGSRHRTKFSWDDVNEVATIDIGALGATLNAGDVIEIRNLRLSSDTQDSHFSTGQVWKEADLLTEDIVFFSL